MENGGSNSEFATAGNCNGQPSSKPVPTLLGPQWNNNIRPTSSGGGIVSLLPEGPACTVNYCGQPNNLPVSSEVNPSIRFLQTVNEIEEYFNWSLTTPGEMTLFTTPGYPFISGARAFYQPFFTVDNGSHLTIGPTFVSSGPVSIGFNGTFRYKQGLNSITAVGLSLPWNFQPWALKVNMDTTLQVEDVHATHRIGVEFVARPDNWAYVPVLVSAPLIAYAIITNPQMVESMRPALQLR